MGVSGFGIGSSIKVEAIETFDKNVFDALTLIYASTREPELEQTDWSLVEKEVFILHQFTAQHDYYQKVYPNALYAFIKVENKIAGRLYLNEGQRDLRIIDIALLPHFRNKKYGTTILEYLKHHCAKKAISLSIHVEIFNPAKRLYQRLGFKYAKSYDQVYELMVWTSSSEQPAKSDEK